MQCIGRSKRFVRCRRNPTRFFCDQHRYQPWLVGVAILGFVATLGGVYRDIVEPYLFPSKKADPHTLQTVRELSNFFSGKSEDQLRDDLGFDEMQRINIDWLIARHRFSTFGKKFALSSFIAPGTTMRILKGGTGTVNLETGQFPPEPSDRLVTHLILPTKHTQKLDLFREHADSPFLRDDTRRLLVDYTHIAEGNQAILGEVLDESARELKTRMPTVTSEAIQVHVWIVNRFARRLHNLAPKAVQIVENLRGYKEGF